MKTFIQPLLIAFVLSFTSCEKEPLTTEDTTVNEPQIEFESRQTRAKKSNANGNKIHVCHTNSKVLNISYNAAYNHLSHGDVLFSCNPQDGVSMKDIQSVLKRKVKAAGGDLNSEKDMKAAFEDWYINDYLTGAWTKESDRLPSSGGGSSSGGIGGGSL